MKTNTVILIIILENNHQEFNNYDGEDHLQEFNDYHGEDNQEFDKYDREDHNDTDENKENKPAGCFSYADIQKYLKSQAYPKGFSKEEES